MANTFTITCKTHGAMAPVLACTHIANAQLSQHFDVIYQVPADNENQIQTWCETCETARMADQGWYDAADAIAKWSYICINCFHEKAENCDDMICYEGEETPVDKPV